MCCLLVASVACGSDAGESDEAKRDASTPNEAGDDASTRDSAVDDDASSESDAGLPPAIDAKNLKDLSESELEEFCAWTVREDPLLVLGDAETCPVFARQQSESSEDCASTQTTCAAQDPADVRGDLEALRSSECDNIMSGGAALGCDAIVADFKACLVALQTPVSQVTCATKTLVVPSECAGLEESCPQLLGNYTGPFTGKYE